MSLTYSQWVTSLANLMVIPESNAEFVTDLPNIRDYAELRLYRDLDLVDTSTRDSSATMTAGNRNFTFPSSNGTFVVTDELNVITPASATTADGGTRNALVPTSEEMLNMLWPAVAGSTVPQYFAMVNQDLAIVGPWPDQSYRVEVVGTIRPQALSSTNVTTILSWYFPDLFLAASMVRASGFQKNYGAAVDDPKQAMTWESQYQSLLASADIEEARKKFEMRGWSSKQPTPQAVPPRT
jgi:hypothetical protein